jgi:hypothetical protein
MEVNSERILCCVEDGNGIEKRREINDDRSVGGRADGRRQKSEGRTAED